MRFFFYGTLLDPDVMALVIGRRLPPSGYVAATLPGYARRRAKGASYPIVLRDQRAEVHGAVVGGLSTRDVTRLAAFEGPRYRIGSRNVRINERFASPMTLVSGCITPWTYVSDAGKPLLIIALEKDLPPSENVSITLPLTTKSSDSLNA